MDHRIKGVLLGIAGIILWFMPLTAWDQKFMGEWMTVHQAGHHIGGIAYLLLLASTAYAALSWLEQHPLRIIAGAVATGISLLFLVQAGANVAWGLLALIAVSGASVWFAVVDGRNYKAAALAT